MWLDNLAFVAVVVVVSFVADAQPAATDNIIKLEDWFGVSCVCMDSYCHVQRCVFYGRLLILF